MPIAHFTNLTSTDTSYLPLYKNLYEVTFSLPNGLSTAVGLSQNTNTLLLENAISVTLPTYPSLTSVSQRFKYSTRLYATMPETTSLTDVKIDFNLFHNTGTHNMDIFRALKGWYDLSWNNETGELNYKEDTRGTITVDMHDKNGIILRRIVYYNAVCNSITGFDGQLSWESSSSPIGPISANFLVDYWQDFYY
jgi:hypothetical protein